MRRARAARRAILAVAVACAVAGLVMLVMDAREAARYDELEKEVAAAAASGEKPLSSLLPGSVAWLTVENTPISYPVMQADAADPDFYLSHDAWGAASGDGVPYLDARCEADGRHLFVFGHHLIFTDRVFSPIYRAYEQSVLDGIGDAVWDDGQTETTFAPVMAMSVDKEYAPVQRFFFTDASELREWLLSMEPRATARTDGWEERISGAERVLTLVTCSSDFSGQRRRTLLFFVA